MFPALLSFFRWYHDNEHSICFSSCREGCSHPREKEKNYYSRALPNNKEEVNAAGLSRDRFSSGMSGNVPALPICVASWLHIGNPTPEDLFHYTVHL